MAGPRANRIQVASERRELKQGESDGERVRSGAGQVLGAVARVHRQAEPERVVRGEEKGGAEALELERSRHLDPEAVPDAVRGEHEEGDPRRDDDRQQQPAADEGLTSSEAPPDIDERQRHEHGRVELRGDRCAEREVPEPEPPAEKRSESRGGQRGGPEVEPREHDRPQRDDGERGEPEDGEHPPPPGAERDERNRQADHDHLAEERHLELEPAAERVPVRAAERRQREHG